MKPIDAVKKERDEAVAEIARLRASLSESNRKRDAAQAACGKKDAAINMLVELCNHAAKDAFKNGATDTTGSIDEGDVIAGRIMEQAQHAMLSPFQESETCGADFVPRSEVDAERAKVDGWLAAATQSAQEKNAMKDRLTLAESRLDKAQQALEEINKVTTGSMSLTYIQQIARAALKGDKQ